MKHYIFYILMVFVSSGCRTESSDKTKPFEERKWRLIYYDTATKVNRMIDQTGNIVKDSIKISYQNRSWSPDGKKIADYSGNYGGEATALFMYDIESGRVKEIAYCGAPSYFDYPIWSPSGNFLIAADGFGYEKIVDTTGAHVGIPSRIEFPVRIDTVFQGDTISLEMGEAGWNKNGDGIYISEYMHGEIRLYEVSFPEGQVRALVARRVSTNKPGPISGKYLHISPDGTWLLWNTLKPVGGGLSRFFVSLMHRSKTVEIEIGEGEARWSNDSDYLVYWTPEGVVAYEVYTGAKHLLLDKSIPAYDAMLHFDDMEE